MACINHEDTNGRYAYIRVWSLAPVICSGLVPVNRSALTYWEEDIPSRIDLNWEVQMWWTIYNRTSRRCEDIFKLLVVSVPFVIIMVSLNLLVGSPVANFSHMSRCSSVILYYFTYSKYLSMFIGTLVYEFVIYPLVRNKLPSILRRIGAALLLVVVLSIVSLVVSVVSRYNGTVDSLVWHDIILQVMKGLLKMVLMSSALEFVCAQSPYNMRTLVIGYTTLLLFIVNFYRFLAA